ncbi:colicin immunity domain-containing protein [Aestuariispira ectoiniformans]|uniref:colicin immunity domain-containing protein n=1 Tax=Aestuariispira ectoiniformans TaxID=2775080 RepID=UPI00223AD488|nr:colicin immunity domain-containing protein [Aestuariispira ectoiniformans]
MSDLRNCIDLVKQFVSGEISASDFETSYLKIFSSEEAIFPEAEFSVLNKLFTDVDAFCSDVHLRDEDDIGEEELLECAQEALKKLSKM